MESSISLLLNYVKGVDPINKTTFINEDWYKDKKILKSNLKILLKDLKRLCTMVHDEQNSINWFVNPVPDVPKNLKYLLDLYAKIFRVCGNDGSVIKYLLEHVSLCCDFFGVIVYPSVDQVCLLVFVVIDALFYGKPAAVDAALVPLLLKALELLRSVLQRTSNMRKTIPIISKFVLFPGSELLFKWNLVRRDGAEELYANTESCLCDIWCLVAYNKEVVAEFETSGFAAKELQKVSIEKESLENGTVLFPAAHSPAQLLAYYRKCICAVPTPGNNLTRMIALRSIPLIFAAGLASGNGLSKMAKFEAWVAFVVSLSVDQVKSLTEPSLVLVVLHKIMSRFVLENIPISSELFQSIFMYVKTLSEMDMPSTAFIGVFAEMLHLNFNESAAAIQTMYSIIFRESGESSAQSFFVKGEITCKVTDFLARLFETFSKSRLLDVLFDMQSDKSIYKFASFVLLSDYSIVRSFEEAYTGSIRSIQEKTLTNLLDYFARKFGICNELPADFHLMYALEKERLLFAFLAVMLSCVRPSQSQSILIGKLLVRIDDRFLENYEGIWFVRCALPFICAESAVSKAFFKNLVARIGDCFGSPAIGIGDALLSVLCVAIIYNQVTLDNLQAVLLLLNNSTDMMHQEFSQRVFESVVQHLPFIEKHFEPSAEKTACITQIVLLLAHYRVEPVLVNSETFELENFGKLYVPVLCSAGLGVAKSVHDILELDIAHCNFSWKHLDLLEYAPMELLDSSEKLLLARIGVHSLRALHICDNLAFNAKLIECMPSVLADNNPFDCLFSEAFAEAVRGSDDVEKALENTFGLTVQCGLAYFRQPEDLHDCELDFVGRKCLHEAACGLLEATKICRAEVPAKLLRKLVSWFSDAEPQMPDVAPKGDVVCYVMRYSMAMGDAYVSDLCQFDLGLNLLNTAAQAERYVCQLECLLAATFDCDALCSCIQKLLRMGRGNSEVSLAPLESFLLKSLPLEHLSAVCFRLLEWLSDDIDSLVLLGPIVAENYRVGRKQGLELWFSQFLNIIENADRLELCVPIAKSITKWINVPHFALTGTLFSVMVSILVRKLNCDMGNHHDESLELTSQVVQFCYGAVRFHRKHIFQGESFLLISLLCVLLDSFRDFVNYDGSDGFSKVLVSASAAADIEKVAKCYIRVINVLVTRPNNSFTDIVEADAHVKPIAKQLSAILVRFHNISCTRRYPFQSKLLPQLKRAMFSIMDLVSVSMRQYMIFNVSAKTQPLFKKFINDWELLHRYKGQS